MKQSMVTITIKKAAPVTTRNGLHSTDDNIHAYKHSVPQTRRRVNLWPAAWGMLGLFGTLSLMIPAAYNARGYLAFGGEWLAGIAAGVLCWCMARLTSREEN